MKTVLVSLQGRSLEDAVEQCLRGAAADASTHGRALSVWLSGALARPFLFGPVSGLRGWNEGHEAAQSTASHACGIDGPCRVVLESDPSAQAVVATAVQEETLHAIYRVAAALRLRIKSIRPAWAEAIDAAPRASRDASLLVCRDVDSLTLLGLNGNRYELASTYAPQPGVVEVDSLLQRMRLSHDVPAQATLEATIVVAAHNAPKVTWSAPERP